MSEAAELGLTTRNLMSLVLDGILHGVDARWARLLLSLTVDLTLLTGWRKIVW